MFKIKFTNEVGGKKWIAAGMWMVSIIMSFLIIMLFLKPSYINLIGVIGTILLTGITAIVLFLTLQTYGDLLEVSQQTLSFTKTQTSYNSYFDNYKLFFELSKMKTDKVYEGEVFDAPYHCFDAMTFSSIHFNYLKVLELFPQAEPARTKHELVFKRFNRKIQSFIDILTDEVKRIISDPNLLKTQKMTLINLYRNFITKDYINLCDDLYKNRSYFKQHPSNSILDTNLLKCNEERIVFDMEKFLNLYTEIDVIIEDLVN